MRGTPNQEPSRRRSSETLEALAERCRWQRLRHGKSYPEVAVGGTSLIPEGPDNGSAMIVIRNRLLTSGWQSLLFPRWVSSRLLGSPVPRVVRVGVERNAV